MFIVIELQVYKNGTVGNIVTTYDDLEHAYEKFYDILRVAVVSDIPKHSAVILDQMGTLIDRNGFVHPIVDEEPTEDEN